MRTIKYLSILIIAFGIVIALMMISGAIQPAPQTKQLNFNTESYKL